MFERVPYNMLEQCRKRTNIQYGWEFMKGSNTIWWYNVIKDPIQYGETMDEGMQYNIVE